MLSSFRLNWTSYERADLRRGLTFVKPNFKAKFTCQGARIFNFKLFMLNLYSEIQ